MAGDARQCAIMARARVLARVWARERSFPLLCLSAKTQERREREKKKGAGVRRDRAMP
jgi:hypothetical protein